MTIIIMFFFCKASKLFKLWQIIYNSTLFYEISQKNKLITEWLKTRIFNLDKIECKPLGIIYN